MLKLNKPDFDVDEVYVACISRVRNSGLRARLQAVRVTLVTDSDNYDLAATANHLHRTAVQPDVNGQVSIAEMADVYKNRMAKIGAPGRSYYDALFNASPSGKCPFCAHRDVSTLDHYLPKTKFPSLAVTPVNLVPACYNCNYFKSNHSPTSSSDSLLHPYYDDIDADRWLEAVVLERQPAVVQFHVQPAEHWGAVKSERVEAHFAHFRLGLLYSIQAAEEMSGIRRQMMELFDVNGSVSVKDELYSRALSYEAVRRNGWRTATYFALSNSAWYCEEGFRL